MKINQLINGRHLASRLGISFRRQLMFWLYKKSNLENYKSFSIPKKSGGTRSINAPKTNIKLIQRSVLGLLTEIYKPRPCVHGFVNSRSIVTNADIHVGKRLVLNIDLKDFFGTVHFGRIKGRLQAAPYNFAPKVATIVAHLSCFEGRLAQGAPTSPILANMVCDRLDGELVRFCKKHRCEYTRYADDITISTNKTRFPKDIVRHELISRANEIILGIELEKIFKNNDFEINLNKVRLQGRGVRQEVTGHVVNKKRNVPRKFVRQVRAMLHAREKFGEAAAADEHFKKWRRDKGRLPDYEAMDFGAVVKGKIEFIGQVRGKRDSIFQKLARRFNGLVSNAPFAIHPLSHEAFVASCTWVIQKIEYPGHPNLSIGLIDRVKHKLNSFLIEVGFQLNKKHRLELSSQTSLGTAFFLKDIGFVTCAHCLGDETSVFDPKRPSLTYKVTAKYISKVADIAVLKFEDFVPPMYLPKEGLIPASKKDVESVKIGDRLVVAGFPGNLPENDVAFHSGEVTRTLDRSSIPMHKNDPTVRLITDASIFDGFSGGPAYSKINEKVIGIAAEGPGLANALSSNQIIPLTAVTDLIVSKTI